VADDPPGTTLADATAFIVGNPLRPGNWDIGKSRALRRAFFYCIARNSH